MLTETLLRLNDTGLDQTGGPTALAPGGAMIARNTDLPADGGIHRRGGYRRWIEPELTNFVTCLMAYGNEYIAIAGDVDVGDM